MLQLPRDHHLVAKEFWAPILMRTMPSTHPTILPSTVLPARGCRAGLHRPWLRRWRPRDGSTRVGWAMARGPPGAVIRAASRPTYVPDSVTAQRPASAACLSRQRPPLVSAGQTYQAVMFGVVGTGTMDKLVAAEDSLAHAWRWKF
jgi:hypothetical protein